MAHRVPPPKRRVRHLIGWPSRFVRRARTPLRRGFRALLLALVLLAIPSSYSYATALTAPGSAPWQVRSVEWLGNHGFRWAVLWAERTWYSIHQPPVGGTPVGGLPYASGDTPAPAPTTTLLLPPHLPAPAPVRPLAGHPLKNEGQWQPVGRAFFGVPALRVAYLRPDPVHTSLVAGLLWMDTTLLKAELIPGTQVPAPGASIPGPHWQVPGWQRPLLAATFNSGFLMRDARGGWYSNGRTIVPLLNGAASLVIDKNGTATVAKWGRDARMGPNIAAVRQNLSLIVDHGRALPNLNAGDFNRWGATLGNQLLVWRSGVGVTPSGALIYANGPGLSVQSLANLLARAGCVRAMELDINTDWTSAYWYGRGPHLPFGVASHKLLPDMIRVATRYLVPDERDFFAMLVRSAYLSPPYGTSVPASGTSPSP